MLTKLENIEQYHEIVSAFKEKHRNSVTNLVLPVKTIENLIANKKVSFCLFNNCLFFVIEQYHVSMLYFYANNLENVDASFYESQLFLEILVHQDNLITWDKILSGNGFNKKLSYSRMIATEQSLNLDIKTDKSFEISTEVDKECTIKLLKDNFDLVGDRLPEEEDYDCFFSEKYIIQINDIEKNECAGVLVYSVINKMSMLDYIIVNNEYRGHGVSKMLMSYYLNETRDMIKRYELWVLRDNPVAISLYLNMGYKLDTLCKELYTVN